MGYLSREAILAAPDLTFEDVAVPEWGGTVRLRGLTGAERDQYEAEFLRIDTSGRKVKYDMELGNARARLVALSVVDGQGQRLFDERDVEALGRKSGAALDRVYAAAKRLSGLSEEDMEELQKNSRRGPDGDSATV